jgi:outer membrane biosynthesis protein TonB
VVVLIADLGLAVAGAVMLGKGLSKSKPEPKGEPEAKPAEPPKADLAPAPAAVPAVQPPQPPPSATVEPAGSDAAAARKDDKASKHHDKKVIGKVKPGGHVAAPVDPYGAPDVGGEVDRQAARSRNTFARCYDDANAIGPIHGSVRIAFQVLPDGTVAHAVPVDNTTGSQLLASCLTSAIAGWTLAPHTGPAAEFVRPFSYP